MADITQNRIGQINGAGADNALFLKKWAGEVMVAFEKKQVMMDKHLVRHLKDGKSSQFPATGRVTGEYHAGDGTELDPAAPLQAEIVISADDTLLAQVSLGEHDEALNHYDARSIYTGEMGKELARLFDLHVMIEGLKGAAATATVTGEPGGTQIVNDFFKNDGGASGSTTDAEVAQNLVDGLFQAAEQLDDNNVDQEGRFCVLRPQDYYILVKEMQTNGFSAIHSDIGGRGSIAEGTVMKLAGITIISSPYLPKTNVGAAGLFQFHGGDYSKTIGLIWTAPAIGTVKWRDMNMDSQWLLRNLAWLFVSKYIVGHGFLRPESLIELKLNTLTVL